MKGLSKCDFGEGWIPEGPDRSEGTIRVRFRGEIGEGILGDMAIDAVSFFDADTDTDVIFGDRFESVSKN